MIGSIRSAGLVVTLLVASPLLLAFGPFSCSKEPGWKSHSFAHRDLNHVPTDVRLPRELWEKIEILGTKGTGAEGGKEGAKEGGGHEGGGGEGHAKVPTATVFAPLKIYLVEKNPGILQNGHTEIAFGPGGGELDLRDFIEPHNGSFYFVAEFVPDLENVSRRVFYVSNGVQRKLGKESYGAGCDTYFDVSTAFDKALKGTGFLVNTTDGRHVSALAGSYFFAASHEGKLYLASLTIRDSEQRSYQCRR